MELSSVRELKQMLAETLVRNMTARVATRAFFGEAALPMSAINSAPRSLALGVAPPRPGHGHRLAVRVQHRALENGPEIELITQQARGEVDIRYIGVVSPQQANEPVWNQQRVRPLQMGTSIGHYKVTSGTLGAFVRERQGGALCILSNNHVLANTNRGTTGDAILQQGLMDGGVQPGDEVGKLGNFIRLSPRGTNLLDCAIASVNGGIDTDLTTLQSVGTLSGLGDEFLDHGTPVQKIGRTTGHTLGSITAFELDNVVVTYRIGNLSFDDQVEIEGSGTLAFSDGGDSGALIFDDQFRGVGLLFAGSDQGGSNNKGLTYANPLGRVLDALSVDLAL